MMHANYVGFFTLIAAHAVIVASTELTGCTSSQFLEYGTKGIVNCKFPSDFSSIYWYDSVDDIEAQPTLTFDGTLKAGEGFSSGEFDVHLNGTLIINNVSLVHETNFKVVCVFSNELFNIYQIAVTVTVTPPHTFPKIRNCSTVSRLCISDGVGNGFLTCDVYGAKPPSDIAWFIMEGNLERSLNSTVIVRKDTNITFHSSAIVYLGNLTTNIIQFVCRSKLQQEDTWRSRNILVDLLNKDTAKDISFSQTFVERGKPSLLGCSSTYPAMFVWRKVSFDKNHIIGYGTRYETEVVPTFATYYEITIDGALKIYATQILHEGRFICSSSIESRYDVSGTELIILVPPSPSYILIEECKIGNCIVTSNEVDSLTCSVNSVRPPVFLQWLNNDVAKVSVSIANETTTIKNGLYDITSSVHFKPNEKAGCGDTFKLTCAATGPATQLFRSSTEVHVIAKCSEWNVSSPTEHNYDEDKKKIAVLVSTPVFFVIFIMGIATLGICLKLKHRNNVQHDEDEGMQLMDKSTTRKRQDFIKEIADSYQETILNSKGTRTHRPKKVTYVPNDLFIMSFQRIIGKADLTQRKLHTIEEIMHVCDGRNVMIEGVSGVGKTVFVHQVVGKWLTCTKKQSKWGIIIMLSLKTMNKMTLLEAIRYQLLPEDSEFHVSDIETILRNEESVLLLLDDFDQYSEIQDPDAEIHRILEKKKMNYFKVVLLSTPFQFERLVSMGVIILQMKKFSRDQIDQYVNKFFDKDGDRKAANMKAIIDGDVIIQRLCEIPIFLDMIACRIKDDVNIAKTVESTSSLRYLIKFMFCDIHGNDILCRDGYSRNCVSKIAIEAIKSTQSSFQIDHNHDVEKDLKILIERRVLMVTLSSFKVNHGETIMFCHDIYKFLCAAHYLLHHIPIENMKMFLDDINIKRNIQLFIYACGLCEQQEIFNAIINYLLNKQVDESYPYSIAACIVQCFNESSEGIRDKHLLEKAANIDYMFNFRMKDSAELRKAKISFLNICSVSKVPVNTLSIYSGITKIQRTEITLSDCNDLMYIPEKLNTIIIDDLEDNISGADVMCLLEHIQNLKEVLIYSPSEPTAIKSEEISVLQQRTTEMFVLIWITFKQEGVTQINHPSEIYECWLNCFEATAIKLFRRQNKKVHLTAEDQINEEKQLVKDMKRTGVRNVLENKLQLSSNKVNEILAKISENERTLTECITTWHSFYKSVSEEEKREHRNRFKQLVHQLQERILVEETEEKEQTTDNDWNENSISATSKDEMRVMSDDLKRLFLKTKLKSPAKLP